MPASSTDQKVKQLQAENRRLRAENKQLRAELRSEATAPSKTLIWRKLGVGICILLATLLLVFGNILFWSGNTIVKPDRYTAATAPIIQNKIVQQAIAANATEQLFKQVDIDQITQDALPPRAAFLAPTLSSQIKHQTDDVIQKILQRPQFQQRWNTAQERAHDRFINTVEKYGKDGSIDLNEVYSSISQQLKTTRLSFLADKPLPSKVGKIEVVSGSWLTILQRTIQNIDLWRTLAIILLVAFSALGVWLSRNRRKTVIKLAALFALGMFATILGLRIGAEVISSHAQPQNAAAVREVFTIFTNGLLVQTWTLFAAAVLIAFVAWISGPYRSSQAMRLKIDQFFSGRLHQALFGENENGFTLWLGKNKRVVEWLIVAITASTVLFIRLTPAVLTTQILVVLLLILIVEVLAAPSTKVTSSR